MAIELRNWVVLRDAEAARIARWFGDTDLGPVFFADSGEALPLDEDERDLWRTRAERALDTYVTQYRRVQMETIGMALTLMALVSVATRLIGHLVPSLATIALPLLCAPALLWPLVRERMYRHALKKLRRALAERLQFRAAVPHAIAVPHKRHNLFQAMAGMTAIAALAIVAVGLLRDHNRFDMVPIAVLMPVAWLFHWAGRRVDRVHRRRPESLTRSR